MEHDHSPVLIDIHSSASRDLDSVVEREILLEAAHRGQVHRGAVVARGDTGGYGVYGFATARPTGHRLELIRLGLLAASQYSQRRGEISHHPPQRAQSTHGLHLLMR